jgi:hypothetical protein
MSNLNDSRVSVAVNKATTDRLKAFAKKHKLKIYEVVEAMSELAERDGAFAKGVIESSRRISARKEETHVILARKLSKLPPDKWQRLQDMTAKELETILDKVG